jgi:ribosomal protein S24E
MQVTIIETKEQPTYKRELIRANVGFQGKVPTRHEVVMALSKKTGKKEAVISVRTIVASYGTQEAKVEAFSYADEKALKENEPSHIQKRTEKTKPKTEEKELAE